MKHVSSEGTSERSTGALEWTAIAMAIAAWAATLAWVAGGRRDASPAGTATSPVPVEALQSDVRLQYEDALGLLRSSNRQRRVLGMNMMQEVTRQEPGLAPAYSAIASVLFYSKWDNVPLVQLVRQVEEMASRAHRLDATIPEPLHLLAGVDFRFRFDWASAERRYRAAIDADPSFAPAHHHLGLLLLAQARFDEALVSLRRAGEIGTPEGSLPADIAYGLFLAGRWPEALAESLGALEGLPDRLFQANVHFEILLAMGREDEARRFAERFCARAGWEPCASLEEWYRFRLDRLEAGERQGYRAASEIAVLEFRLGRAGRAMETLGRACRERSGWSVTKILVDPRFAELRRHPGFASIRSCLTTPLHGRFVLASGESARHAG